jgi:rod shape-determining protein MreD
MGWWSFLAVGFYLCGVLTVIPLPTEYLWFRPHWLLMFLLFCQIYNPSQFNLGIAWVVGLLLDGLLGTPLGQHALLYPIICYLTTFFSPFLQRPLWQQMGRILLFVCVAQIITLWFHAFAGQNPHTLYYWAGSLTSALIWPLFVIFLKFVCLLLHVAPSPSRSI